MKTPIDINNLEKFLLEMSMYQDQLLQNYRLIFISSQTILISIAMLLLLSDEGSILSILFYSMLFGIGLVLLYIWGTITENRELDVSYCHMQLLKLERNEQQRNRKLTNNEMKKPFDSFKKWQQYTSEAKINKLNNYDEHLLESSARKKMNNLRHWFYLTWVIGFIVWIILVFNNQYHFLNFL